MAQNIVDLNCKYGHDICTCLLSLQCTLLFPSKSLTLYWLMLQSVRVREIELECVCVSVCVCARVCEIVTERACVTEKDSVFEREIVTERLCEREFL